jgi:hypothetical protein
MTRNNPIRKPTTLAEAIHIVERSPGLSERAQIVMHVGRMNLNAGKHLHLVVLDYKLSPSAESTFIPLQSGNTFRAIEDITSQRREYPIEVLDGGTVSHDAVVTLQDGTTLRAVEIIPGRLPYQFTPLDEKIIHAAISVAQIEGSAYRSFREGLPEEDTKRTVVTGAEFFEFIEFGEFVDGFKFIDFGKLAQVEKPRLKLKHIQREFIKLFPAAEIPSEQKISDTLALVGLWNPKRRPKS